MPLKVRRHKKNKTIRHTNKKRLKKKLTKIPNLKSKVLASAWNDKKSVRTNLAQMGLSHDPNFTIRRCKNRLDNSENEKVSAKGEIAKLIEKEAKAPRVKKLKFSQPLARYFTYLIEKYKDNYKEMAKDPKNVYQETWKQIRRRILQFKKLEQYQKFVKNE